MPDLNLAMNARLHQTSIPTHAEMFYPSISIRLPHSIMHRWMFSAPLNFTLEQMMTITIDIFINITTGPGPQLHCLIAG